MATNVLPFDLEDLDSDSRELKESGYFQSLSHNPGWKKVVQHMNVLVEEAENDMKRHTFDDPVKSMRLQMRWQQRGMMRDTVIAHVQAMVDLRREILARKNDEYHADYTTD